MNLQDLKAAYLARHRMSLDDSAVEHVSGFAAFLESAMGGMDTAPAVEPEASGMPAVVAAVTGDQPPSAAEAPSDPAVVASTETVVYPDGTSATGMAPLPADSPAAA